jgi:hypothetical protein
MNDQLIAKAATYITHNKHKRRTSMSSVEFELMIPAIERQQTYALNRTAFWELAEQKQSKAIHFNWNNWRAIFKGKLLIFQDNSFVACREIFSAGAGPA